jgi:flagellar hook-associated protein 3 FlgL
MRISTDQFLLGSLGELLAQESMVNQLNREIATGQTMLDATGDPAGAGQALGVLGEINQLAYDTANAQSGTATIQNGLSVLQQVSSLIDQFRQIALQGANSGATAATRQALVSTAQSGLEQLVQLANSQGADGSYIFAGSKTTAAPFQTLPNGQIVFSGDSATNAIEIAPSLTVPVTISGQSVFTNIPAGNNGVSITAAQSNTGGAYAVTEGVTSIAQVTSESLAGTQYEIGFSSGAGNSLNYTVVSGSGSPGSASFSASSGTVASGSFTAGSDLRFGGIDISIDGTPASGDRFIVQTGTRSNLFQTVQNLISAVQSSQPGQAPNFFAQQQIQNAIANLDNAQNNILAIQATLGSNLTEIQGVLRQDGTQSTNAQAQLDNLQSANLPQVLASYSASVTALQAAELAFTRIQNLSLFSMIQP